MNWSEACNSVGYDLSKIKPPERIYSYFAYKDGEAIPCNTPGEAMSLAKHWDSVIKNKEEISNYWKRQAELENKATEVFYNALQEEYSYIPDAIYSLCYSKAYEDGHSCGYDEVAGYLQDYVEFAESIIKASKE